MKRLRIDEPHQQTTTTIKDTISQDRLLSSSVAHVTPSTPQIVATANLPLNALGGSVGISGIQQYHQQQRQPILHHPITQSYKIISEGGGGSSSSGSVNSGASAAVTVISSGGSSSMQSGLYQSAPTSVNFGAMPSATVPHSVATRPSPSAIQPSIVGPASAGANREQTCTVVRANSTTGSPPNSAMLDPSQPPQQQSPASSFHRLKVEDALSYLDLVKYKFGSKPQVYNDFLDIMKEFKSQSIDTPGVIQRVSNLFKGFPDLIVGFNTFLPPGYKIEVQKNDQGYAFQVSVSMPSPTGGSAIVNSTEMQHHSHHHPQPQPTTTTPRSTMILKGAGTINLSGGGGGGGVTQGNSVVASAPPPSSIPALHHSQQQQQVVAVTAPSAQTLSLAQQQQHMPPVAPQSTPLSTPVVHHSSSYGSSAPAYGSLSMSAAVTHALQGHTDTPQNQPVEFNHAINYVNKIKNRFQGQPEKYKKFLEILHTYQKEQRTLKESGAAGSNVLGGKHLTEQEVYSQVAKLFENQSDLLAEFGQFLPDATSHMNQAPIADHNSVKKPTNVKPSTYHHHRNSGGDLLDRHNIIHKQSHVSSGPVKRSPTYPTYHRDAPPPKKHKLSASASCRDVTLSEAGKFGTLNDYAFFDKVRKAVRTQEVYNNFLRCLTLFNQEIVSKSELIAMVTPFLSKFPELLRWFREFMGQNETAEPVPYNVARTERPQGDHALEIDLATAKRLGASYCIIPKAQEGLRCSGRTQLCKEVLNDQWVSFPTWSEDSTFVSSRKTQYEEYMYRCEDERFELDVVIETNATTIRVLEGVNKKLSRMSQEEVAKFKLDDCLGGSSPTLHQRALKRIYGDKAQDIIDGLKRNPAVAVPVVLRRLKAKEEEWREAQKGFNKIWREQNEKYYLKSLDHQGINFKQTDVKALRSKSLFNEIETLFDERHEQNEEASGEPTVGPHLILPYKDRTILDDATNLLIHHVKRHTGIQKGEKQRIKQLLRQFLPDLFFYPRQQLSDDEREDDDEKDEDEESSNSSPRDGDSKKTRQSPGKSPARAGQGTSPLNDSVDMMDIKMEVKEEDPNNVPLHAQTNDPEEAYTLFMANNNWYIFLRLHAILCERLAKIYERACILAAEEAKSRHNRKESTAIALRLKPKPQIEIEDYYPAFLDMVKNLLDGNMEANTFEDTLREMFGIHAYIAFTLDKVVSYAVRQLQHCVTERTAIACTELFLKEQKRGAAGGPCETAYKRYHMELAYQRAGERAVQDESCFKIYIYKKDCKMTIELLDTEQEDTNKKVEENKKWSSYKENYSDCTSTNNNLLENRKVRSPVYLSRNLRLYKRKALNNQKKQQEGGCEKATDSATSSNGENDKFNMIKELERKLNEKAMPERSTSENIGGYQVNDEQECKFNLDAKILFTVNKDSCLYKMSAFQRAKKTHPQVTKRKGCRFRAWLKKWASANVSDNQSKSCTDWMMGRCEGVVANRTRVVTDNDLTRSPYVPYNRYRVERLHTTTTNTTTSSNNSAPSLALPPTSSIVAITPTTGVSAIAATPSASAATSSTTVDAEHSSSSSSSSPPSSSPTISSSTTTS